MEAGTVKLSTVQSNLSTMSFYYGSSVTQTQPKSFNLMKIPLGNAVKTFKHLFLVCFGNTDSIIAENDFHGLGSDPKADLNTKRISGIF